MHAIEGNTMKMSTSLGDGFILCNENNRSSH